MSYTTLLDPENIFWAMTQEDFFPQKILSLYLKVKDKLSQELKDFRFSQELAAIYIDPTDRCNANCPYCYIPEKFRKNGVTMDKEQLGFILEKIVKYFRNSKKKPVIVFHAAEPLLVKEMIFEAISKYSKLFKFGLQTNAILLEKKDVEFLKRHRVGVGISLDSYSPIQNNRLRRTWNRGGNFKEAVRAIEYFNGYPGLNVITTVTKLNVADLPNLVKFLHSKLVPCVLLNPIRLTQPASRRLKPKEGLLTKYFIKAVGTAIELTRTTNQPIIVGNFANIILGIVAPTARRLMCDISPCGGGRCFFTITASGEMIPCGEFIGLKKFSGGNIFSAKGIKDIITQAMQSHPFKMIRDRYVEKISECKVCIFRNICGAPCPAELYATGNMFQKSIFCDFYKKIIGYAFKLIAEGKEKYCFRKESLANLKYAYLMEA